MRRRTLKPYRFIGLLSLYCEISSSYWRQTLPSDISDKLGVGRQVLRIVGFARRHVFRHVAALDRLLLRQLLDASSVLDRGDQAGAGVHRHRERDKLFKREEHRDRRHRSGGEETRNYRRDEPPVALDL